MDAETEERNRRIGEKTLFLLDMDGTVYLEDELIAGAKEFIEKIRDTGRDYVFMTNNSSRSAAAYLEKLKRIGLPADETNIFTSGQAAAIHLPSLPLNDRKKRNKKVKKV